VAEKFKGSDGDACAEILSSKLTSENVKAVSMAATGLARGKVTSEGSLARIPSVLEILSEKVWQRTYVGMKIVVESISDRLAGIDGEVAEEDMKDVEEFMGGGVLARQRALLQWAASGFQGEFEPARGFSPEGEKKLARLEANLLFVHVDKKDPPCSFLRNGGCKKGDKCDWGD
jgi:RNase P/RNase MRP subunit p29